MKKEHVELIVAARKWQNEITNRHDRRNRRQSTTAQEPLNTIAALWSDIVAGKVTSNLCAKIVKIRYNKTLKLRTQTRDHHFREEFPDEPKAIALHLFYLESCDKPDINEMEKLINLSDRATQLNWLQTVNVYTKVPVYKVVSTK